MRNSSHRSMRCKTRRLIPALVMIGCLLFRPNNFFIYPSIWFPNNRYPPVPATIRRGPVEENPHPPPASVSRKNTFTKRIRSNRAPFPYAGCCINFLPAKPCRKYTVTRPHLLPNPPDSLHFTYLNDSNARKRQIAFAILLAPACFNPGKHVPVEEKRTRVPGLPDILQIQHEEKYTAYRGRCPGSYCGVPGGHSPVFGNCRCQWQ